MRDLTGADQVRRFMRELGRSSAKPARIYLTGGASAVLLGWRAATIDVDIKVVAEDDEVLRAVPRLKDELRINVELASPEQFIPPLPGWEERSRFIADEGRLAFFHYDFYAQALAKIERGHRVDLEDAAAMLEGGLIEPGRLREFFGRIEPELYRYPAVDAKAFRAALDEFLSD
ncbi:MAG: hypothetical protein HY077_15990 [Elusimicrobia bacterium]|nr:hypothetical protein [Elusimicrobiota bacterium]